ncbi:MAG: hypothetical protein WBP64_04000 [Nitrososphaeraceae archaeon]
MDDNFDCVTILKHTWDRRAFIVSSFMDPQLALKQIKINAATYDLVISELRCPE